MLNFLDKETPLWHSSDGVNHNRKVDSLLTVVSFNIQFALRLDEAISELKSLPLNRADIILLQEMDENGTIYLSEKLDYNYVYFPMNNHPKYSRKFGNAILSKWPIVQPEKIVLPYSQPLSRLKRGVTSATIRYGDREIRTYSLHLETPVMIRKKRLEQLQSTLDIVNEVNHTDFVIFGGDFNSVFPKDVREMVNLCQKHDLEWSTAGLGHTLTRWRVVKPTLDHIFSKGFDLVEAGKIESSNASDHYPIWAKLKFN